MRLHVCTNLCLPVHACMHAHLCAHPWISAKADSREVELLQESEHLVLLRSIYSSTKSTPNLYPNLEDLGL